MEFSNRIVNGILVFSIKGQIRISTQEECRENFNKLIKENSTKRVVLNLSDVGYMNSAGIGMIVECFRKFSDNGGKIVLCGLVSDIAKLFEITQLDKFIEIYQNEEEAIQCLLAERS